MERNMTDGSPVEWEDLVPFYLKSQPHCPTGGEYTLNPIGTQPTCSLYVIGHHN